MGEIGRNVQIVLRENLNNKQEGFFRQRKEEESDLPFPEESGDIDVVFINKLKKVEKLAKKINYRGSSICRICGKRNGGITFVYNGWEWPSGYLHYIEDHGHKPTKEFFEFIDKNCI